MRLLGVTPGHSGQLDRDVGGGGEVHERGRLPWPRYSSSASAREAASWRSSWTCACTGGGSNSRVAQLCLRPRPRVYSVVTAMDPACREMAAGHALLHLLCADLTTDGCTALDLGRTTTDPGQRAYKAAYGAIWTTTHTFTHALGPVQQAGLLPADDRVLTTAGR
ncbi:GNAT family N-acetyltransferase [Streptomyces sp. 5112.2]|uniref:GNAT family N-acetyltransferase n=1 Tax=Streptomyces sp. 5112.2 TaxID=1938848 RepID=UPI00210D63A0|nr:MULTISPECIES: GNAT family N-acetyltransferase [unclassified Streptomyces]